MVSPGVPLTGVGETVSDSFGFSTRVVARALACALPAEDRARTVAVVASQFEASACTRWEQPYVQASPGDRVASPLPWSRMEGAESQPGSTTVTWPNAVCPELVTRMVNRAVEPTRTNAGAAFVISIDGGQVTVS